MQKEVNVLIGLELVPYMKKDFLDSLSKKNSELGKDFHFNFKDDFTLKPNEYSIEINGWKKAFVFEKTAGEENPMISVVDDIINEVNIFC